MIWDAQNPERVRRYRPPGMPCGRLIRAWSSPSRAAPIRSRSFPAAASWRASGSCQLAGLAHLHHQIRGAAADLDAGFCRQLAARAGVPAVMGNADVPALARSAGVSLEVAGRDARQRFYLEARATLGAGRVAVRTHARRPGRNACCCVWFVAPAHVGLAGIAPRRDHLVRPLLEVSRAELRAFLAEIGESWRDDESNADCAIPRNLIRHDVLPRLRELNAQADAALARTADIIRTDAAFLDGLANEAAARVVRIEAGAAGAAGASGAQVRRVSRVLSAECGGRRRVGAAAAGAEAAGGVAGA